MLLFPSAFEQRLEIIKLSGMLLFQPYKNLSSLAVLSLYKAAACPCSELTG